MKKILVPTDFSKTAAVALETAVDIAKKAGSQIIVLHVVEEITEGSFNVEGVVGDRDMFDRIYTMKTIEKARKQLEKTVMDPRFSGIRIDGELRMGNTFHGMRTIINEHKVDLIVMGTATQSKVEEMLIGSNTEKVVRSARCPVLTVNKKPASTDFKNIVYATALAKDEEVFSRIIKTAQRVYNSTIHLVRINTPGDFQRDAVSKSEMEKFAKKMGLKNYTINVYNDSNVEEGIIRFADTVDADMIGMATHGRTGFAHVIAGSVAEDVVSHAKRPVLTFVVKH